MSLHYSSFLNREIDWTGQEIAEGKKWLNWEDLTINWEDIDLLWEEIFILLEVKNIIRKRGGGSLVKEDLQAYIDSNPWDSTKKQLNEELGEEKTKKFIKLFCKVNNLEYEKMIESNSDVKLKAEHFERVFNKTAKVDIKI